MTLRLADEKGTLLSLDRRNITFTRQGNKVTLKLSEKNKQSDLGSFKASRDMYVTLKIGDSGVSVNGKKVGSAVKIQAKKCQVWVGYNPIFDAVID